MAVRIPNFTIMETLHEDSLAQPETIRGTIKELAPEVTLSIKDRENRLQLVSIILDTGFDGYLALPSEEIKRLGLVFSGQTRETLADGREVICDTFLANILWQGETHAGVKVLELGNQPLMGMALLSGNRVELEVKEEGSVTIEPL